jgi:hypothetical protein
VDGVRVAVIAGSIVLGKGRASYRLPDEGQEAKVK